MPLGVGGRKTFVQSLEFLLGYKSSEDKINIYLRILINPLER